MKTINKTLGIILAFILCGVLVISMRINQLDTEKTELIRINKELRSEITRLKNQNGILHIIDQTREQGVTPQGSFGIALRDLYVLLNDLSQHTLIEYNSTNEISVVVLEHNGTYYSITIGDEWLPPNKFTQLSRQ